MNGVVRPTVSQSHIAVATRPWLNRHTAAQGDLWASRLTAGTAQVQTPLRSSNVATAARDSRSGLFYTRGQMRYRLHTHGWLHSIKKIL